LTYKLFSHIGIYVVPITTTTTTTTTTTNYYYYYYYDRSFDGGSSIVFVPRERVRSVLETPELVVG